MSFTDFWQNLLTALAATSALEWVAVLLGIAYLILAAREHIACWYAAFISTAIYIVLFWKVALLMESALQLYYLGMAVYGWWQWRGGALHADNSLRIRRFTYREHMIAAGLVLFLTLTAGFLLDRYTQAALPWLDAFTTWGAVITTWMVTRKILENWLYWLLFDGVSIYLYLERGLALTALLFVLYLFIVIIGYLQWRKQYQQQSIAA